MSRKFKISTGLNILAQTVLSTVQCTTQYQRLKSSSHDLEFHIHPMTGETEQDRTHISISKINLSQSEQDYSHGLVLHHLQQEDNPLYYGRTWAGILITLAKIEMVKGLLKQGSKLGLLESSRIGTRTFKVWLPILLVINVPSYGSQNKYDTRSAADGKLDVGRNIIYV